MGLRIVGYDWPLPSGWHWLPGAGEGQVDWSRTIAERLVPNVRWRKGKVRDLTEKLQSFYLSGPPEVDLPRVAVLYCEEKPAEIMGHLLVDVSRDDDVDRHAAGMAEEMPSDHVTCVVGVEGSVPAGRVKGIHATWKEIDFMRSYLFNSDENHVVVVIGPPGCSDLVRVQAKATFPDKWGDDAAATLLDMLRTLTIQTEN